PDLVRAFDGRVERDVGVAVLRGPDDCFRADDARNPDARIGSLQWHRPRIDNAVLVMLTLPAERPLAGPGGDDQIVRLLEALAVERRIDARRQLLLPAAADKPGDETPFRDHV